MLLSKQLSRNIVVLDNGGETLDRYTIIDRKTSDVFGCSTNPFHPQGFGQYSHNIAFSNKISNADERMNRICVNLYLKDCKNVGKRVKDLNTLPIKVRQYIYQVCDNFQLYNKIKK